jgi:hypothetical protein
MGELVPFHDPRDDDPYYTEKVWFGSQDESGGLTQDECDSLAEVWRTNQEVDEHKITTEAEFKRWQFVRWLREHGKITDFPGPDDDLPPAA